MLIAIYAKRFEKQEGPTNTRPRPLEWNKNFQNSTIFLVLFPCLSLIYFLKGECNTTNIKTYISGQSVFYPYTHVFSCIMDWNARSQLVSVVIFVPVHLNWTYSRPALLNLFKMTEDITSRIQVVVIPIFVRTFKETYVRVCLLILGSLIGSGGFKLPLCGVNSSLQHVLMYLTYFRIPAMNCAATLVGCYKNDFLHTLICFVAHFPVKKRNFHITKLLRLVCLLPILWSKVVHGFCPVHAC